jgi:hypothetical protein
MCWYDPPEESKRLIKSLCQQIVDEVRRLEEIGDPIGISIRQVKELIDHLDNKYMCKENPKNE